MLPGWSLGLGSWCWFWVLVSSQYVLLSWQGTSTITDKITDELQNWLHVIYVWTGKKSLWMYVFKWSYVDVVNIVSSETSGSIRPNDVSFICFTFEQVLDTYKADLLSWSILILGELWRDTQLVNNKTQKYAFVLQSCDKLETLNLIGIKYSLSIPLMCKHLQCVFWINNYWITVARWLHVLMFMKNIYVLAIV